MIRPSMIRPVYPGARAEARWHEPAVIMAPSGRTVTFGEYEDGANRLAQYLRSLGLRRGDHVAVLMENNARYFEAMAAAERTGLYYTCVNSHLTAEEAAYIIDDCDAQVVVTSAAMADVAVAAAALTPKVRAYLCVDTDAPIGPLQVYDQVVGRFPAEHVADEQLGAAMLYSSGTTGRPKGILRPLPDAHPSEELPVMTFTQSLLRLRDGMTYLSPAPIYHSAPQASVSTVLRMGATAVVMEQFEPEECLALIAEHRVTHTNMVPTMFVRMLKLPAEVRARYDVSSLEAIAHTGAPCPVEVKQAMIDWVGPILVEYYGSTEANGFTFCDSQEWLAHRGTVGRAVFGEVVILDDDGHRLGPGQPGAVWFQGATNFTYYQDPDKTAEGRDPSGQRSTVGDVGYLDEEGYLYLTDRRTFMIVSGGVNIYPQEIENLLVTHPDVLDAAVFGVPNPDLGEEVKAVVQPLDGVEAGPELAEKLLRFCREHLAHYKCPRSVDFEAQLPRLPTGKLYKRLLRDRYWGNSTSRII